MKKLLAIIALTSILTFSFFSCKKEESSGDLPNDTDGTVTDEVEKDNDTAGKEESPDDVGGGENENPDAPFECAHNWNFYVISPGCIESGFEMKICLNCGESVTVSRLDPLGHSFGTEYFSDEGGHWQVCEKCNEVSEKAEHNFEGKSCAVCSMDNPEISYSEGLAFTSNEDGTCFVSGIGTCTDTDIIIPPTSPRGEAVVAIGEMAFYYDFTITSITIPEGVTVIGGSAFEFCYMLSSVSIPESVRVIGRAAFQNCTKITSLSIPNGVDSIGDFAFYACTSLKSAQIADSVTSIGDYAFSGCMSLENIYISKNAHEIGMYAFYLCSSLQSVIIPEGVENIGRSAFSDCTALSTVVINGQATNIASHAFVNCTSLESVVMNDGVTGIGRYAFWNCSQLTSVTIPGSVCEIGNAAFLGCSELSNIFVHIDNEYYKDIDGNLYTKDGSTLCQYPQGKTDISFTLPDGVTTINESVFRNSSLSSIIIPKSVVKINSYAFENCQSLNDIYYTGSEEEWQAISGYYNMAGDLANVNIHYNHGNVVYSEGLEFTDNGDGTCGVSIGSCTDSLIVIPPESPEGKRVSSINYNGFYNCTFITSVILPDTVSSIGYHAFEKCTSLVSVYVSKGVKKYTLGAFEGCTSLIEISVSADNEFFMDVDGNLFSKDGECLIQYAIGKSDAEYVVPSGVREISTYAFSGCSSLVSLILPDGLSKIGDNAFENCTSLSGIVIPEGVGRIGEFAFDGCYSLSSVVIPQSVTTIARNAFYNCTALTDVYYTGTEAQWNGIFINTGNEKIFSATIHKNFVLEN